jgi:hypothetical protein
LWPWLLYPPPGPYQLLTTDHPLRRKHEARMQALSLTAELPMELAPEPLEYDYVGELYRRILAGFLTIDEKALFIGPSFDPARPVGDNPRTREHRDAPVAPGTVVTMIKEPGTLALAELFNAAYLCSIAMLQQYYSFGGETPRQRTGLQQAARELMSVVIRPLGEVLTAMDAGEGNGVAAGPPFEFYYEYQLPTQAVGRWTILLELLKTVSEGAAYVAERVLENGSFSRQRARRIAQDAGLIRSASGYVRGFLTIPLLGAAGTEPLARRSAPADQTIGEADTSPLPPSERRIR